MSQRLPERQAQVVPPACQLHVHHAAEPRLHERDVPDRRGLEHVLLDPLGRVEEPYARGIPGIGQSSQHLHWYHKPGGAGSRERDTTGGVFFQGESQSAARLSIRPLNRASVVHATTHHRLTEYYGVSHEKLFCFLQIPPHLPIIQDEDPSLE